MRGGYYGVFLRQSFVDFSVCSKYYNAILGNVDVSMKNEKKKMIADRGFIRDPHLKNTIIIILRGSARSEVIFQPGD